MLADELKKVLGLTPNLSGEVVEASRYGCLGGLSEGFKRIAMAMCEVRWV